MKFLKFIIENYRAINGPLVIDIDKNSLIPIIGVNECGKTTILQAIFAFDHYNDELNEGGRHLRDSSNLYSTSPKTPIISAEIDIDDFNMRSAVRDFEYGEKEHFKRQIQSSTDDEDIAIYERELEKHKKYINSFKRRIKDLPNKITIHRNLKTNNYSCDIKLYDDDDMDDEFISEHILPELPYILYFDDFRDSIEDKIEIIGTNQSSWLQIINRLFDKSTSGQSTVFDLPKLEERQRKSLLSKVKKTLNTSIAKIWPDFNLDNIDSLEIDLDYYRERIEDDKERHYIKLEVVETDSNGFEHFFFIGDRSKGFYWFFNFVMKLEFNPKISGTSGYNSIYLLDEPGSYLHAAAQTRLCNKLNELSEENKVIYCTHSHYLLNPDVIPISKICVASKDGNGSVDLLTIHDYKGEITERRSAFQPILDALEVKPFNLDLTTNNLIIVEGIIDYYTFNMFADCSKLSLLPSVGASSIKFYISLMIAWNVNYVALWDNDKDGVNAKDEAIKFFGIEEGKERFKVLPLKNNKSKKRILQDLYDSKDIKEIKNNLGINPNTGFDKMVTRLYHSKEREKIIDSLSGQTKNTVSVIINNILRDSFDI
jgi:energy-coupling factor transporter ATP-binding protein EcfA2